MYKNISLTIIIASAIAAILIVPWAALQRSHAQSDLSSTILDIHNRERAAVRVPDLVWSDSLAAGAKTWAEHLATTGEFNHDPNGGRENIAGFFKGVSAPAEGQSMWVDEKVYWNGSTCTAPPGKVCGHYTNMIASDTKEVGCGTASGSGHPYSILVCRYR
jgi:uncharacterized protein YkwD